MERIKEEVEEINWIEQDFGQDVIDQWRPQVAFPAVLIDFPDTSYNDMLVNEQTAEAIIRIRLMMAPYTQSYEGAPIEVIEDALSYFEIEKKIVDALHMWQPDEAYCRPLIRRRASSQNRGDIGLRIRTIDFDTAFEEVNVEE
jgi:hypothetical protein